MKPPARIEILMAEDSPSDEAISREAMKWWTIPYRVHVVHNGESVIDFLSHEPPHETAPAPDLILLDLKMPKKSGLEVLTEIKNHPQWKCIPVIILTASQAEADLLAAYRAHANAYIAKSLDFAEFAGYFRSIQEFWFKSVTLPPKSQLQV